MQQVAIIHYDDIALKGDNRVYFENMLVSRLAEKLKILELPFSVSREFGRIVIRSSTSHRWTKGEIDLVHTVCNTTPGVAVYGIGYMTALNTTEATNAALAIAQEAVFVSFRITTSRLFKGFEKTSTELDRELGSAVLNYFGGEKNVQLKGMDLEIRVEVANKDIIVYEKKSGISGLPVGVSGNAVALLSGGFDSPVAAYMLAKRGVRPLLLHFHAHPQTTQGSLEKVQDLAQVLARYTGKSTLGMVSVLDAQKLFSIETPKKLQIVLLRRLMMRVATVWAAQKKALAIITGEAVGQVASQTLANMRAVELATDLPILRPLSGMNKKEIIANAQRIGTHDISVLPFNDCCTLFTPKRPETNAKIDEVLAAESKIPLNAMIESIVSNIQEETYQYQVVQ